MEYRFCIVPLPFPLPDSSHDGATSELSRYRSSGHTPCLGSPQEMGMGTGKGRARGKAP